MEFFHMEDIIPLIGIPEPPPGRSDYNIPCPCCDYKPRKKHLNINLKKDVFRCPRCGFNGGVFDLYAYYTGIPRESVREALIARLDVRGEMPRPKKKTEPPATPECPLTDIDARHATYEALLGQLSLASDHQENLLQENLLSRGLSLEMIQELGYKTTPVMGMTAIAKHLQEAGYYLSGVPGFYRKDGKWSFVSEGRGILIPVRDMKGRIQGLQIRRDNVTRRKFRWVSSMGTYYRAATFNSSIDGGTIKSRCGPYTDRTDGCGCSRCQFALQTGAGTSGFERCWNEKNYDCI